MPEDWNNREGIVNQLLLSRQNDWIKNNIHEINNLNRIEQSIIRLLYRTRVFSSLNCLNMTRVAGMIGCTKMTVSMNVPHLVDLKIIKLAPYKRGSSRRMWLNMKDYPVWVNAVLVRLGAKTI